MKMFFFNEKRGIELKHDRLIKRITKLKLTETMETTSYFKTHVYSYCVSYNGNFEN